MASPSFWLSSRSVTSGKRMDMVRRLREAVERMERDAAPAVVAADLSEEVSAALSERTETLEAARDAAKASLAKATKAVQAAEGALSQEAARGERHREEALGRVQAAAPEVRADPILQELGYRRAADAARERRLRKDKLERLVRPGTTVASFDARWGTALRACETAEARPPAHGAQAGRERAAVLAPGWAPRGGPPGRRGHPRADRGPAGRAGGRPDGPGGPGGAPGEGPGAGRRPPAPRDPFAALRPGAPRGHGPQAATQCLRELPDGSVGAAECDPSDPEQLWGQVGRDLVGYAHGGLLPDLRNSLLAGTLSDATGRSWPFTAPSLDASHPRGVAFSWSPGVVPRDGTMVLRQRGRRLLWTGQPLPMDSELCLGTLQTPCRISVRYRGGQFRRVTATQTGNSRVWQADGDTAASWRRAPWPRPQGARCSRRQPAGDRRPGRAGRQRQAGRPRPGDHRRRGPQGPCNGSSAAAAVQLLSVQGLSE